MITAVFLPGKLCDQRIWADVMTSLSDIVNPIFVDLSKYGTLEMMLEEIAICSDKPIILLGFSMGGYVAQEYILRYPQKIAAIVLVSTFAEEYDEQGMERQYRMLNFANKFYGLSESAVRKCIHSTSLEDVELLNLIKDMAVCIGKEGFIREQQATMHRQTRLEELKSIKCPALIISGDEDNIVPIKETQSIADYMPNAEYHKIEKCGHMVPIEQSKLLSAAIGAWLIRKKIII